MARFRRSLALTLSLAFGVMLGLLRTELSAVSGGSISKRWYSVKKRPPLRTPGGPPMQPDVRYKWPKLENKLGSYQTSLDVHPIYYCYTDQRSAKNLKKVVKEAKRIWEPALYPRTSLMIALDPGCAGNEECVCDDECMNTSSLRISDESKDKDHKSDWWQWNYSSQCKTGSSKGYNTPTPTLVVC